MLRFSLLTLLIVVLVAAVGSAALADPTDTWRQMVVTGTVGILLFAMGFAVGKRPVSRFALGFGMFGWVYLVLTFSGVVGVREDLLTERASAWLCQQIHQEETTGLPLYDYLGDGTSELNAVLHPNPVFSLSPTRHNFTAIARSLWTLILATIGGMFASWLGRRRTKPPIA